MLTPVRCDSTRKSTHQGLRWGGILWCVSMWWVCLAIAIRATGGCQGHTFVYTRLVHSRLHNTYAPDKRILPGLASEVLRYS